MGKEKDLVANLRGKRLTMENDATLLLQIAVGPYIVVAREEMHLHTKIGQFRELAEEASATLWHDILVFVPKVEHIAQKIDCAALSLILSRKRTMRRSCVRRCGMAQDPRWASERK